MFLQHSYVVCMHLLAMIFITLIFRAYNNVFCFLIIFVSCEKHSNMHVLIIVAQAASAENLLTVISS